jgi:hypothetical protein
MIPSQKFSSHTLILTLKLGEDDWKFLLPHNTPDANVGVQFMF